jgi:two-component system sensor histidine kinase KdpD
MTRRAVAYPSPVLGLTVGLASVVAISAALVPFRSQLAQATPALALVLPVLLAASLGGVAVAVATAVGAGLAFNIVFIRPYWTVNINHVADGIAFVVFLGVAGVAGTLAARLAEGRRAAERRTTEIESLHARYETVVADRERLREETHRMELLERVDQQRSALLRSVSHDLRTPLATIRAATSDIQSGTVYDEATRDELLDLVGDEAERLDRLVSNLLSLSRIEAGALQPERQAVALDELVAEERSRLARLLKDIELEVDLPADLPPLDADYSQLDQVLTNLLENAARHAPDGSVVRLSARRCGDVVEVSVSDEGHGIDSNATPLFEPFRPGAASEGSGVGLAICKAIVEAHGGTISGANQAAGGARFAFTIPVHV